MASCSSSSSTSLTEGAAVEEDWQVLVAGRSATSVAGAAPAVFFFFLCSARRLLEPACGVRGVGTALRHGRSGAKADLTSAEHVPAVFGSDPTLSRGPPVSPCKLTGWSEGVGAVEIVSEAVGIARGGGQEFGHRRPGGGHVSLKPLSSTLQGALRS